MGPTFAAVFVAEIGDHVARAPLLCLWAGLTPKHQESDSVVHRGHITKQGSRLVRWAAVEAVQQLPVECWLRTEREAIAARRAQHRQGRRHPQAADAGLLRPARRRDPLHGRSGGRVSRLGRTRCKLAGCHDPHLAWSSL